MNQFFKKLLGLIIEFRKLVRYQIDYQNQLYFYIEINNQKLKFEKQCYLQ